MKTLHIIFILFGFWDYYTGKDFETVNGIDAHGGSIDGPGPKCLEICSHLQSINP